MRNLGWVICVAVALLPTTASAFDFELENREEISSLKQDLAVPDSPAFVALGLNPEEVARPATVHEFSTAILSGLDKNGNFQAGVALDFAPYLMIKGDDLTLYEYRNKYVKRLASSAQISVGTTKGTASADESLRLGFGFRAVFWNRGDPRMDKKMDECLKKGPTFPEFPEYKEEVKRVEANTQLGPKEKKEAKRKVIRKAKDEWDRKVKEEWFPVLESYVGECIKESEKRLWNSSAFDVGAAPTLIQKGGNISNISWGGATFWGSLAYGFDKHRRGEWKKENEAAAKDESGRAAKKSQLILHVRYRLGDQDPVAQDVFVKQNSLLVGTRVRAGKSNLNFSVETSYVYENAEGASGASSFRGALNADIKVIDQAWLLLGLGLTASRDNTTMQLGAGFKWGGLKVDLKSLTDSYEAAGLRTFAAVPDTGPVSENDAPDVAEPVARP